MSLKQYFWDAYMDLVETIGALEDHAIPKVDNKAPSPTASLSSLALPPASENDDWLDKRYTKRPALIEPQHIDPIRNQNANAKGLQDQRRLKQRIVDRRH